MRLTDELRSQCEHKVRGLVAVAGAPLGFGAMRKTISDLAREGLRLPLKGWLMLAQHYAEQAASDPARRAERLERPPMFPGAHASERWHAAEMQYRSQLHQLQQEAERKTQREGAPWWRLASILYSAEMLWTIVAVFIAVGILRAFGEW